jgi:hypothetical protein
MTTADILAGLRVDDPRCARLLAHIAENWRWREAVYVQHHTSAALFAGADTRFIDHLEGEAQRTLNAGVTDLLVLSRALTWWEVPPWSASRTEPGGPDQQDWRLLERGQLPTRAQELVAAGTEVGSFMVRAEALTLPPFVSDVGLMAAGAAGS